MLRLKKQYEYAWCISRFSRILRNQSRLLSPCTPPPPTALHHHSTGDGTCDIDAVRGVLTAMEQPNLDAEEVDALIDLIRETPGLLVGESQVNYAGFIDIVFGRTPDSM